MRPVPFIALLLVAFHLLALPTLTAAADPDDYIGKKVEEIVQKLGNPTGRMTMGNTELLTYSRMELTAKDGVIVSTRRLKAPPKQVQPKATPPADKVKPVETKEAPAQEEVVDEPTVEPPSNQVPAPVLSGSKMRKYRRIAHSAASTNQPAIDLPKMQYDREKPSVLQK